MLAYLCLALFSVLNISEMTWMEGAVAAAASNIIAILVFLSTIAVPIWVLIYFWRNRERWQDDDFADMAGTLFEGVRHDERFRKIAMVYMAAFFVRRFLLAITLVYWQKFVWAQIALQLNICIAYIICI